MSLSHTMSYQTPAFVRHLTIGGFVVSVFGLREHHGVRERFGLQDLVLEPGSGNSLVREAESVLCTLPLAGSNKAIDSWVVLGARSGTGSGRLASLTRIVASDSWLPGSRGQPYLWEA